MSRLPDWEARLHAYLEEVREKAFAWGEHDCALHGANVVKVMTGEDHGAPFRGRYSTPRGAAGALRRYGAGTLEATFDSHLEAIPPAFAGRGDLVLADGSLGVCMGGFALFVGAEGERDGLVRVARAKWVKAWRVA